MRSLLSYTLETVLEKPNEFQIYLLEAIKQRYVADSKGQSLGDSQIQKLLRSKNLLMQEERLAFFWRFQQLSTLGALAFTDMNEADYVRTLRLHWLRLDFKPVLSNKDVTELLEMVKLYHVKERMAYECVHEQHRIDVEGVTRERALKWLVKKAIDEAFNDADVDVENLVLKASQFAAMNYFELTPKDLQAVGDDIPDEIDRYGLTRAENLEGYRKITEMRIEFELWYQVVPDILKRKRVRSHAKEEIRKLMGDKTVAAEIAHEAKSSSSKNTGLASFCLGLMEADKRHYEPALEHFNRAVKQGLTDPILLIEKAFCHFKLGEFMAAARILDSFDRRSVEDNDRDFLLDVIDGLPTGSYELAWNLARKYRLTSNLKTERLREFGEAFIDAGELDTAKSIFEQVLEIDKKEFDSYFFLARICYRQQDIAGAKAWIDNLIKLEQRNFYSYYRAAMLYLDLGDRAIAMQFLTQCFELNAEYQEGRNLLVSILKEVRDNLATVLHADPAQDPSGLLSAATFNKLLKSLDEYGLMLFDREAASGARTEGSSVPVVAEQVMSGYLERAKGTEVDPDKVESLRSIRDGLSQYLKTFKLLESLYEKGKSDDLVLLAAEELMGQQQYRAAGQLLREHQALAGEAQWWYLRGLSEYEQGHLGDAESHLREGWTRGQPRSLLYLGRIYAQQKRVGEAAQVLNTYVREHSPNPGTSLAIAETFANFGDLKAAQNVLRPFMEGDPPPSLLLSSIYLCFGDTFIRMGGKKRSEAEEYFRQALARVPKAEYVELTNRAIAIFRLTTRSRFLQIAIKTLTPLFERHKSPSLSYCLARIYHESAQQREKKTHLQKGLGHAIDAIAKDPINFNYRFMAAALHDLKGEAEFAAEQYSAALELAPRHFESLQKLAIIEFNRGNDDKALDLFNRALQQQSNDAMLHYYLAKLYQRRNDLNRALTHAAHGIDNAYGRQDAQIRKELTQDMCELFYDTVERSVFAATFIRVIADPDLIHRREIVTAFLRDLPTTAVRGETKNVHELAKPLSGIVEKLQSHVSLFNNIPRDLKKTTVLSEQLMKRCLADVRDLTGRAGDPVAQILSMPVSRLLESKALGGSAAVPEEEWNELKAVMDQVEIARKHRVELDSMIEAKQEGTFDYLLEFLRAGHWPDKVMDVLANRILAGSKAMGHRQLFLNNILSSLAKQKEEGIDEGLHRRFETFSRHLIAIAQWSDRLDQAWTKREEISEPLDNLPLAIEALKFAFSELEKEFQA
ncbi:tetratricopeptide repeat protein [bacterium]|nr:tetratricopeptide repeat protein [candidate division CSSED10-310 bacterium]